MSFHLFKSQETQGKHVKISEVLKAKHLSNGDLLNADHLNIAEIDKVPGQYLAVTKLNLSYNKISSLSGVGQFRQLTHLFLSNNQIEDLKELEKVTNKHQIVVLTAENNPFSAHPDIVTLSLLIFPRLVELNGLKLTDHARQDLYDGLDLSKKLVQYLCKNEMILEGLEKDVQKIKSEYESMQEHRKNPEIQGLFDTDKKINFPKLPSFTYHSKIRPYMLLNFIDIIGKSAHYYMSDTVSSELKQKTFKWTFCEILLNLHSWGNHSLQLFLQKNSADPDPEKSFNLQLFFFQSLKFKSKSSFKFSDIFPDECSKQETRVQLLDSYLDPEENWDDFPIFSHNSDYLKAVLLILQGQVRQIEELAREKKELLLFDTSFVSAADKVNLGNRAASYDQDPRASSRTTVKQFGSPIEFSLSPNDLAETEDKRKLSQDSEKTRLFEMKNEIEQEKLKLEQKMKDFEEREKKEAQKIEEKLKENQKKLENFRKKGEKMIGKGLDLLDQIFSRKIRSGFDWIFQENLREIEKKPKENLQDRRAENCYTRKLLKKCFDPLRFFQILAKTKRLKADEYYKGRLLLDSFYAWRSFKKSKSKNPSKNPSKSDFQKEFQSLLKRLISSERNIKKIWKAVKSKQSSIRRECLCGGFKCQVCVQEKTSFINQELKSLNRAIRAKRSK